MKYVIENTPNLDLKQHEATKLIVEDNTVKGVKTKTGLIFSWLHP